jgi:hypothetical protein
VAIETGRRLHPRAVRILAHDEGVTLIMVNTAGVGDPHRGREEPGDERQRNSCPE